MGKEGNEKGPPGASFKTFHRLELICFLIRVCDEMNYRGKSRSDVCKHKSHESQKIARACEPGSWRKLYRSFTHCGTQ